MDAYPLAICHAELGKCGDTLDSQDSLRVMVSRYIVKIARHLSGMAHLQWKTWHLPERSRVDCVVPPGKDQMYSGREL